MKVHVLAGILAQSAAVSAAFGKWLGFVLMMTAVLAVLVLGVFTLLIGSKAVVYLFG